MKQTFSRRERRTRGVEIIKRLRILKNSQILKDADLSELPEEVIDALKTNTCANKELQKRYNLAMRIMSELIELQSEYEMMKSDLAKKKGLDTPEENFSNVN